MYDKSTKTLVVHGTSIIIVLETIKQWLNMGARPEVIETVYGNHPVTYKPAYGLDESQLCAFVDFPYVEDVLVYSHADAVSPNYGTVLSPAGFCFIITEG